MILVGIVVRQQKQSVRGVYCSLEGNFSLHVSGDNTVFATHRVESRFQCSLKGSWEIYGIIRGLTTFNFM